MDQNSRPISRRVALQTVVGAGVAAALGTAGPRIGLAQESRVDCSAVFDGYKHLADIFIEIAKKIPDLGSAVSRATGPEATDALMAQSQALSSAMMAATGAGLAKGAVATGLMSQRAPALALRDRLGRGAHAKLDWAYDQIRLGKYDAVANDRDLGPFVKAGIAEYQRFGDSLRKLEQAFRGLEQRNLDLLRSQGTASRNAKQLSNQQLDELISLYSNNPGIVRILRDLKAIPIAAVGSVPGDQSLAGTAIAPEVNAGIDNAALPCGACPVPASDSSIIIDRLFSLLGVRAAHAQDPATILAGAALVAIVAIAVVAAVVFLATLWAFLKCVITTETPTRFDQCVADAQARFDAAVARARQNRRRCRNTCAFGVCTPDAVCRIAESAEIVAAEARRAADQALCYLTT